METSTPISPPPSLLSMPLKPEHQSPVPQPPRVSSPQQDPSTWPSPGHVTRTSLQMRLQQMAGQPTADEKKAGPTQPMQQSPPPVQVSSLFKTFLLLEHILNPFPLGLYQCIIILLVRNK